MVIERHVEAPPAHPAARRWWQRQRDGEPVRLFEARIGAEAVAAVVLHDLDRERRSALVAYHVYEPSRRRRGVGTAALRAVQQIVTSEGELDELVVITSADNGASQRLAERCGCRPRRAPREGPAGLLYVWRVERVG